MTTDFLPQLAASLEQGAAKVDMNSQGIERIAEYQAQAFQGLGKLPRIVEQQGRNLNQLTLRLTN
jgi:uncharacterized phage infection (PIP) family protein YhgE